MNTLPIELLLVVLQEAQYDDLLPRYKWLKSYALVCRRWRSYAQRLLFTHVALLRGADHCKAFKKSIALCRAKDPAHAELLGNSVRTLAMAIDHQNIYVDVIELCPNLRELHVSLYHASFRAEVLRRFAAAGSHIRALRVRAYRYAPLFQLLSVLPGVEYLEVDCNCVLDALLQVPYTPPPFLQLKELRYTNLHRSTHAFVEWVLSRPESASPYALEVLRVICTSFNPSILVNLGVAPTLKSITLQHLRDDDDLSAFTNLKEIAVTYPQHPSPTFRRVPDGVSHLSLDALNSEECKEAVGWLTKYHERTGGGLRVLTYNRRCDDTLDSPTDVEMLRDFCLEFGIEFRLMDPPYGFYAGEVPLEEAKSFPRALPMSSRRPALTESELSWVKKSKGRRSLARRFMSAATKAAFKTTIPPMALAKP